MIKRIILKTIKFYQRAISPLLKRRCCFNPTCSEYARLALEKHGLLKGLFFTSWRVLRCHPWQAGGLDLP